MYERKRTYFVRFCCTVKWTCGGRSEQKRLKKKQKRHLGNRTKTVVRTHVFDSRGLKRRETKKKPGETKKRRAAVRACGADGEMVMDAEDDENKNKRTELNRSAGTGLIRE